MGKTRGRCVNISLCMCVKFSKKEIIIKTMKEMSMIYNGEKSALQSTLGR